MIFYNRSVHHTDHDLSKRLCNCLSALTIYTLKCSDPELYLKTNDLLFRGQP